MWDRALVSCLLVVFIILLIIAAAAASAAASAADAAAESAAAATRVGGDYWQLDGPFAGGSSSGGGSGKLEEPVAANSHRASCCTIGGGIHSWALNDLHTRGATSGMLLAASAHDTGARGGDLSVPKPEDDPDNNWANFRNYGTGYSIGSEILETKKTVKRKIAKRPWQSYESWDALKRDPGASADYFELRTAALNNPEFDWSRVYQSVLPLLDENREYVGVVGIEADGYTLKLLASEASPDAVGEGVSSTYFAGVPAELVAKYAERPALFFFHTHPADERASPLPSSPDLATAIYFAATARFAASAIISRFGVLIYGLAWPAYKSINNSQDWKLALLSYTHDVIASHEAIRSWTWHTLKDYIDFYARMRLIFYAHPSPAMVALGMHAPIMHSLESDVDHEIIDEYSADIAKHIAGKKRRGRRGFKSNLAPGASSEHIWTHDEDVHLKLD